MVDDAGVAHSSACFRWLDLLRGPAGRARQSRRAAWGRTKEAPTAFCPGVAACGILRAGLSERLATKEFVAEGVGCGCGCGFRGGSEGRRVGKEGVRTCRSRGSPDHE